MSGPNRRVRVVCRPATAAGFALCGVAVELARDADQAAGRLRELAADPKCGVVLVDELLYRALPAELKARYDRAVSPLVAPFPVPQWGEREAAVEYVLGLLQAAIGYRVRAR